MAGLPFVPEEDVIICVLFPVNSTADVAALIDRTASSVSQRAAFLGLKKDPAYLATKAHRFNGREPASVASRFKPGQTPPNKGLRRPGWAPGRMAQTQFRRGQMPHNHKPVGHERINADGYRERKVAEPKTFRAVHVLVWEAAHGPVPAGHIVVFKPGRRTTDAARITPDALEVVTRAENMRRNSRHTRYPPEVNEVMQLAGALKRKINNRREKHGNAQ